MHDVHTVEIHTSQTARELLARVIAMSTHANASTDVERLLAEATTKQGGERQPMDTGTLAPRDSRRGHPVLPSRAATHSGENEMTEPASEAELADTSAAVDHDVKASAIPAAPPSSAGEAAAHGDDLGMSEMPAGSKDTAAVQCCLLPHALIT